jgi:energy-coupling factor transporter ATP-binding protein EcfA2
MAIKISNLSFAYNGEEKAALKGINLHIMPGERVLITGPNGSGKTTLVKHFNALLRPSDGDVRVFGKSTKKHSTPFLAGYIGLVFQNPNHQLFAETVREELEFGVRNLGVKKPQLDELCDTFMLRHLLERAPYSLSMGEKKRVAVASVLAMKPEILVLDEPFTGLDYKSRDQLMKLLQERATDTVIIVSHNVHAVAEYVDRVIELNEGMVTFDGSIKAYLAMNPELHPISQISSKLNLPTCVKKSELVREYVKGYGFYI